MADQSSNDNAVPRDDVKKNVVPERAELSGPQDGPLEYAGDDRPRFEDTMLARQSVALRHIVPDAELLRGQSAPREIADASGISTNGAPVRQKKPVSILRKRMRKFKTLKRGYYSFLLLVFLYLLSFLLPVLVNNKALVVHYNGSTYFPALLDLVPGTSSFYPGSTFGTGSTSEADYRVLDEQFEREDGGNWILMPLYEWDPYENDFSGVEVNPAPPSPRHLLGTDDIGRDVFARMCYGFNISISFALLLVMIEYAIGATIGGIMGFYAGKVDLFGVRFIEIWGNIPFLYTVIIISSIVIPSFSLLLLLLATFGWVGITMYMRGMFFQEKAKDYVSAAVALGASDRQIIFKHILPNSLTPMISFFPFAMVGGIGALVSLDYLGFGLPPPTPSWGQMVHVGLGNLDKVWLVMTPLGALFATLLMVTFIGEAVREAFDPKVYSRLR
jgi:microcin C transport system permease protein